MGYKQSDEISLVLVDYHTLTTDAWLGYSVEKMCSISASMATMAFNRAWDSRVEEWYAKHRLIGKNVDMFAIYMAKNGSAMFDSRVFNVPKEEVNNCILWRQQDATRNSVQLVGQANFSHKQLQNKSCDQIQEMLFSEKGINWNDYPTECKRGTCCIKQAQHTDGIVPQRKKWVIDKEIPIFSKDPMYIARLIFI